MSGVFISYRRDDRPGFAGRLTEALEGAFGAEHVFRDIEDIRPGEDFVATIHSRLESVDVVLAMIGPAWLDARKDGERRLDEPDDFVRLEIASALASGKPVWPVLVGGAIMPTARDLPEPIRDLAQRQAVVLSDAAWKDDVARLIGALRPLLAAPRRRSRLSPGLSAGLLVMLGALFLFTSWMERTAPPPTPASRTPVAEAALSGRWTATVRYDWGAEHEERFDLRVEDGEVLGTASYLGVPRSVEQGTLLDDARIRFVTRTESWAGTTTRSLTHSYRGRIQDDGIHFVLETVGQPGAAPVEFVARRTE
jgi:hypothetical protein